MLRHMEISLYRDMKSDPNSPPNEQGQDRLHQDVVDGPLSFAKLKESIRMLSDDQRLDLFRSYCPYCGCYDEDKLSGCQCWNDD